MEGEILFEMGEFIPKKLEYHKQKLKTKPAKSDASGFV
jgi:hypothetical protein